MGTPTSTGPRGSGQLCRLVNQVTTGAVAEGLSLAAAGGADPAWVRQTIMDGLAGSRILEMHGARMNERHFGPGGTSVSQIKDLGAVLKRGQGGLNHSALILKLERLGS